LFLKPDDKHSNRLRECEIGEELSYKEGAMPPAWTGKVEVIDGKRKPDQAELIEKLTAELSEKDQAIEKLTAELDELTKPAAPKKLENATK
jgi:hypothetical protein